MASHEKARIAWQRYCERNVDRSDSLPYDIACIVRGELTFVRQGNRGAFFVDRNPSWCGNAAATPLTADDATPPVGQRWYRHMTKDQFEFLVEENRIHMVDSKAYVAISTSFEYSQKYVEGGKRNGHTVTHVVELTVSPDIDLDGHFEGVAKRHGINNLQPKIEDGAFSWGLGPQCRNGILGVAFNDLMASGNVRWRLVSLLLPTDRSPVVLKKK
eukprot:GFYU01007977.1.p1 GENE.GFYU01007977.1~~GFYU01007977.1.p1  ORF type:complete len:215 (+),score=32.87 GFYU01007977.1:159-803(+)